MPDRIQRTPPSDLAGYDFRSRCTLVPEAPAPVELVRADGTTEALSLRVDQALALFHEALDHATAAGVAWADDAVTLQPMPKLVQLVRASQQLHAAGNPAQD